MKKSEWFVVLFPLFAVWIVDHLSKQWAMNLQGINSYGFVTFILHHNRGAMLGLFEDLPAVLRVVTLSTGGAFLVCSYAIIQYLLPIKSMKLRVGMSILLGGILGNVTDRIVWGHVIDFIILGSTNFSTAVFNVADALQWVGYGLIVVAIIRESELLWPENNNRKKLWVKPTYQKRYSFLLVGVGLSLTLVGAVFSYTYLRVTILELIGNNQVIVNRFLIPFVLTYTVITLAFSTILFLLGKILSHRSAGPVFAFEKYCDEVMQGRNRILKLRAGDEFKELEVLAEKIKPKLMPIEAANEPSQVITEDTALGGEGGEQTALPLESATDGVPTPKAQE